MKKEDLAKIRQAVHLIYLSISDVEQAFLDAECSEEMARWKKEQDTLNRWRDYASQKKIIKPWGSD